MKNFFRSMKAFAKALPHFLLFELLFKLILVAAGAPVLMLTMRLTMKAAKISYISDESLLAYLHSPATLLLLPVILFIAGFFTFVELTALAACFTCYSKGESITVGGMLRTGLGGFKKAFRGTGILRFLAFMLLMPFAEYTLSSGTFLAPLMPLLRSVLGSISGRLVVAIYITLQCVISFIIISRSYSLHYLVLTDSSFPECIRRSREKIGRKKLRMALYFILWTIFILAAIAVVVFGISFLLVFGIKGFSSPDAAFRRALRVLRYSVRIYTAVSAFFSAPLVMCWLTGSFLGSLDENENIIIPDKERKKMDKRKKAVLIAVLSVGAILLDFGYIRAVYKGNIRLNTNIFTPAQISAHRGFSYAAPENTEYAFLAALDSETDYIELDVQLTSDGELVVFHDKTLDRTTDGSGKVTEHTYDELSKLSAGKWFGNEEYNDAKIMKLSEVLELVGRKKLLNIEIKDTSTAIEAAEKTVEMLDEYGLTGSCYVTSFSYSVLKRVKELDPKIKTALIANLAASTSYASLKYIDAVSMNYIFVNKSVVSSVHQNGKLIFVWTVDRKDDIEQMLALGVDNIITNRPDRAAEAVYSNSLGDTVIKLLEAFFGK